MDNEKVRVRNLKFARMGALRACELTEYKDGMILDTLARVYYEMGDLKTAIKWQEAAVENTEEGPMRDQIEETLKKYTSDI